MKNHLLVLLFMLACAVVSASAAKAKLDQHVEGTVTDIQGHRVQSPEYTTAGSNPSDAPLSDTFYSYEVSIRVGCDTYVGRYRTALRYLPSIFSAQQRIGFRLTKHVMYFDVPFTDGIRMSIIRHASACGAKP